MDKNYITAMDKVQTAPQFRRELIDKLKSERDSPRRMSRGLIPAIAAVLVVAVIATILLIPHGSSISFSVAVSAAGDAPRLSDRVYTTIGSVELSGGGLAVGSNQIEATLNFKLDLTVEGEDIATVTYEMENGRITVSDASDKVISFTDRSSTWSPSDAPASGTAVKGLSFYRSVTCDYARQLTSDDGFMVSFGYTAEVPQEDEESENVGTLFSDDPDDLASEDAVIRRCNERLNRFFENSTMTVSITYTDGRRESAAVSFKPDTAATLYEERFILYRLDTDTGMYRICHSRDEAGTDNGDGANLRGTIGYDEVTERDEQGRYRYVVHPFGADGQGYELMFTDDDWVTVNLWGLNYRLTAKLD